jgi:hypothetical protein
VLAAHVVVDNSSSLHVRVDLRQMGQWAVNLTGGGRIHHTWRIGFFE